MVTRMAQLFFSSLQIAIGTHGMNLGFLLNHGKRLGNPTTTVAPVLSELADISQITQHDALVLQLIDMEYQIMIKAQFLVSKSQAETFLMSQAALAQ